MRRVDVFVVFVVLGVGLVACSASNPPPRSPVAEDQAPTCSDAAVHMTEKLRAGPQRAPERAARMADRIRSRCTEDGWTVENRRCFAGAASFEEEKRCFLQLTNEQQVALAPPPPPPPPSEMGSEETSREDAQRGPMPPPPPPPSPSPPSPPSNIAPVAFDALRIAGTKNILPDLETKAAIHQSGKDKLVGSYKLCITAEGVISVVNQLKSTGFPAYDNKIISTIRDEWRYRPFMLDGKATPVCTAVTFIYSQRPPEPPSISPPPAPPRRS